MLGYHTHPQEQTPWTRTPRPGTPRSRTQPPPPWNQAPPLLPDTPLGPGTPQEQTLPAQCMLGDTVNKRAVCILLECNLVTGCNEVVAKVMFLQVCVCPQGGRVSASVHTGMPCPPPPDQADPPPRDQADTPPREADSSIRSTSGRYASYWNAFLLM